MARLTLEDVGEDFALDLPTQENKISLADIGNDFTVESPDAIPAKIDPSTGRPMPEQQARPIITPESFIADDVTGAISDIAKATPGVVKDVTVGAGKGLGSTIIGSAELFDKIGRLNPALLPMFAIQDKIKEQIGGDVIKNFNLNLKEAFKPEGLLEKTGFTGEQIAEFLVPSSKVVKVQNSLNSLIKGKGLIPAGLRLLSRSGVEGVSSGVIRALQTGGDMEEVVIAALVSSLFSVGGGITKKTLQKTGVLTQETGEKIAERIIKPNAKDVKDGFRTSTLIKNNLFGGIDDILTKAENKLSQLTEQLNQALGSNKGNINILQALENARNKVLKEGKFKNVVNAKQIAKVFDDVTENFANVADDVGNVTVPNANLIKQEVGKSGSWAFGFKDPDSNAREIAYNSIYTQLRESIENAFPEGVISTINKQISELIPVSRAAIRRVPIERRASIMSPQETLGLIGAIVNPKLAFIFGAQKLSKSGGVSKLLVKAAEQLKKVDSLISKTEVGKRIFGAQ